MFRVSIFSVVVLLATSSVFAETSKVVIASDAWCPYTCEANNGFDGFSVDLISNSLALYGIETRYVNASFARILANINSNSWHILPATDQHITPELIISSEVVADTVYKFFVREDDSWQHENRQSLDQKKVGIVDGYGYSDEVMGYIQSNPDNVIAINSDIPQRSLLLMLTAGRIDVLVEDERVIAYWANKLGLENKIKAAGFERTISLKVGLANNENSVELINQLDQGIKAFKKTTAYQELLSKYQFK